MQFRTIVLSVIFCWMLFATACNKSAQSYIVKGNEFFQAGKYEDAGLNYRKAIQVDPKHGEAYYRLGLTEKKRNDTNAAYLALTRAVELLPDRDDIKVIFADICLQIYLLPSSNRPKVIYDHLIKVSDHLLAKDPNSFDGLRLTAFLAVTDNKTAEGIGLFTKANAVKPMQPEVIVPLAEVLLIDKQLAKSEKLALELINTHKTAGGAYDVLYRIYTAGQRIQDAENILRSKVENLPKNSASVLQLAAHYGRAQKTPEMKATLQRLLDNPKDFPQARLQIGDFYARIGNPDEALRQFEVGAKENQREKVAFEKRMATILMAQNKKEEAARMVDSVLRVYPNDIDSKAIRAFLLLERGKPALTEFLDLVRQKPNDASYRLSLGRAYMAEGQLENAAVQFREALSRNRNYHPARGFLLDLNLRTRQYKEALLYANEIVALQPGNPRARLLRSISLMGVGAYREARSELDRLIKQYPQYVDVHLQLGLLNIAEKRFAEADAIFRKFYQPGKADFRPLDGLVESQVARNQFDQALRLLAEELKKSPNSAVMRSTLASTAVRAGKYELALEQYRHLATVDPKNAGHQMRLGETFHLKGDVSGAITSFQKAKELAPKNPEPIIALAYLLDAAGRKDEAINQYRQSLAIRPNDALVLNNLAFALAEQGQNLEEALQLALRARQKAPENPGIIDTVGWVYLKTGQLQSASHIFRNLVNKYPETALYHYHLGLTHLKMGDEQNGKQALQKALSNKPTKDEEEKIKELISSIGSTR